MTLVTADLPTNVLSVHQWHHGKEEEILFPLLEKKGIPADGGSLGVMLMEHGRARALINDRYSFQRR